jgi:hypothetical protein
MSLNASYAPQESSADYWNEVTHLAGGTVVCGFAYGDEFIPMSCRKRAYPDCRHPLHFIRPMFGCHNPPAQEKGSP